jgi:hypothetical protein
MHSLSFPGYHRRLFSLAYLHEVLAVDGYCNYGSHLVQKSFFTSPLAQVSHDFRVCLVLLELARQTFIVPGRPVRDGFLSKG